MGCNECPGYRDKRERSRVLEYGGEFHSKAVLMYEASFVFDIGFHLHHEQLWAFLFSGPGAIRVRTFSL
jgi:hypothetical protein